MTRRRIKSGLMRLTALILLGVYGVAGWRVLHPAPSPEYAVYYLKGELHRWPGQDGLKYQMGANLDFSKPLVNLSRQGWSEPEGWGGTWSDGPVGSVFLSLSQRPKAGLNLTLTGHAFVNAQHPLQRVEVLVNGTIIGSLRYDDPLSNTRTLSIPGSVLQRVEHGILTVTLRFPDACAPVALGLSGDTRKLGLGVASMRLTPSI